MTGSAGPTLITHIGQLVTNDPARDGLLGIVEDAAIEIVGERVSWIGTMQEVESSRHAVRRIDAGGAAVVPGFVDSHTHAVFTGDRADEFAMRMAGAAYEDILAAGGGIYSTVRDTRDATLAELVAASLPRFRNMLASGTTTAEVKSGYGLDVANEVKMLEAIATISDLVPIDLLPTFLGAHVVAPEYRDARDEYIDLVTGPMLESVAPLAAFIDVFCDDAAFTVDEARTIAMAGIEHGLDARLHVDQLSRSGGAALAAELGAVSADHLDYATDEDLAALAAAGTVAVLLPGVSYAMRTAPPDARKVWDAGVTVAIATDCNPGTANIETMPFIISLAVVKSGMTPEEALWAATKGGAKALGLSDRGLLAPGTLADLVILDAPTHSHLAYRPDGGLALEVMKRGSIV